MNRNTFSEKPHNYVDARPQYPDELYQWIVEQCSHRDLAWDCATGNGQAAVSLSPYFKSVLATDISEEQISHAMLRENVQYLTRTAENSGFDDGSVDLISVAQALHWFDYSKFWPEVTRVARPGSLFCAWGYAWMESTPLVDQKLIAPFKSVIEPHWASNNKLLWDGYRPEDIQFPFTPLKTPKFEIEIEWTLDQLLQYMMTWSAYKICQKDEESVSALNRIVSEITDLMSREERVQVRMPLTVIAGYIKA